MKPIVLIIFLLSASISAQIINEDEQIFKFFDEFNNSQELLVGKNPYATDGIDSALGEEFILKFHQDSLVYVFNFHQILQ